MSNTIPRVPGRSQRHYAKIYRYPGGISDIIASSDADFGPQGLEAAEDYSKPGSTGAKEKREQARGSSEAQAEDVQRAMRRARAKVRRLALANDFKWFVTLTFDPSKVEAKDGAAVVKKLNAWCSNAVQRHGLRYILVPERHKKGGIHFHGFFSDAVEVVDSGTIRLAEGKKPRRPRSAAQRAEWLAQGGRIVYNLPGWTLGFSTAMELTGEYPAAVAYVCKYIGKDGEKPAGRWYYSGGDLAQPEEVYAEISPADLQEMCPGRCFEIAVPGRRIAIANGLTE